MKAPHVIEHLNDVFGPRGTGWRSDHSALEAVPTDCGRVKVVTEVALQYRLSDHGCGRLTWPDSWEYSGGPPRATPRRLRGPRGWEGTPPAELTVAGQRSRIASPRQPQ